MISGLIAATIGLLQGRMIRLEARNGALWGQMPVRALWLWALLVGSRLIMTVIALAVGAKVAGSSAPIIMLLGINRLGQAAIVMRHALATGIPFAPEKDGRSFLSGPDRRPQHLAAPARPPGTRRSADPAIRSRTHRPYLGRTAGPVRIRPRYPHQVRPPADDADPACDPETGPADYPAPRGPCP